MAFIPSQTHSAVALHTVQILDVMVRMEQPRHLVPIHLYDKQPSYYIFAGLVFTLLSRPFLYHEWGTLL